MGRCTSADASPCLLGRATARATCSTCVENVEAQGHWVVWTRTLATSTAKHAAAMEAVCTPHRGWIATATCSWWKAARTAWHPTSTLPPTSTTGAAWREGASCLRRATSMPRQIFTWMGPVNLTAAWGAWTRPRATLILKRRWAAWPCAPTPWHFTWGATGRA